MTAKQETMILVDERGIKIGACVHYPLRNGWQFIPATTAHRGSRKFWASATACIPKWAFDASEDLLTATEFNAKLEAA